MLHSSPDDVSGAGDRHYLRDRKAGHERDKPRKRLCELTARAIDDFKMMEAGSRVMVYLSGGKGCHALLDRLLARTVEIL